MRPRFIIGTSGPARATPGNDTKVFGELGTVQYPCIDDLTWFVRVGLPFTYR